MKRTAIITGLIAAAFSMTALADPVTFNFSGRGSSGGENVTSTSGTATVNVKAYSTANANGSGEFSLATIKKWGSSGWGIETEDEPTPTRAPNHASDNAGKDEFFVLDFGTGINMDLISLGIGWAQERGCKTKERVWDKSKKKWVTVTKRTQCADTDSTASQVIIGYQADVDVWIGNVFDVSNPFGGLTKIGTFENMPAYSTANEPGALTGRYIVIGAESPVEDGAYDYLDYFKLKSVTVERRDPPSEVPEPSALLLTGLGLLGLAARRRKH